MRRVSSGGHLDSKLIIIDNPLGQGGLNYALGCQGDWIMYTNSAIAFSALRPLVQAQHGRPITKSGCLV